MGKKVIITGSTGMVGKGVLLECLESNNIDAVLAINRESVGIEHRKLKELLHKDFYDLDPIKNEMSGYDVCLFCLGVSSAGMSEKEYSKITFDLTDHFSDEFIKQNPKSKFVYISAAGADSSENGRIMWARIRGRIENRILNKGFKDVYIFRPAIIIPVKGVKSKTKWVKILYIIFKPFNVLLLKSKHVTTTSRIGLAMINLMLKSQNLKHLENSDINYASKI